MDPLDSNIEQLIFVNEVEMYNDVIPLYATDDTKCQLKFKHKCMCCALLQATVMKTISSFQTTKSTHSHP